MKEEDQSKVSPETSDLPNGESNNKPLEQSSLAAIKSKIKEVKDGELVKLPISHLVFRLTKPSISKLLKENVIPEELVVHAINLDSDKFEPTSRKQYLEALKVIDMVVQRACIFPKVSMEKDNLADDEISINDIEDGDRMAIYLYAQTGVKPLIKFRKEPKDGDAGSGVQEVPRSQTE